jgi:hypothetical protein
MADADNRPRVPAALKKLVLDYQNTCVFMLKAWRRLMMVLAVAFPAAFYLREATILQAMVNAVGLWLMFAILGRCLVLEFRFLRAGWVARTIERRMPAGHPSRQAVIDWIGENNDGNFLNSLLKKLGVAPQAPPAAMSYDPTTFINGVLEKLGQQEQQATHTYVYSSQTQMLNQNGEWVTVESDSAEETEPPEGFKPIPIAVPQPKISKSKKRKKRQREYMPLDPEVFEPDGAEAGADGGERR